MILRFLLPLLFTAATVSAAPFAPEPLLISGPSRVVWYGRPTLSFPFTLSGGPATVSLAVFTRFRAPAIRDVRNGYLGWHSVNCIDTCVYISPPAVFPSGENTIVWDLRDKSGTGTVSMNQSYSLRYTLWAYDAESPPEKAVGALREYGFGRSLLFGRSEQGEPYANPILFSAARPLDASGETWNTRARWILGGDPDDVSLIMTTRYRSHPDRGRMALDPLYFDRFFTQTVESGGLVTRKWQWMPNGDAVLQTGWAEQGAARTESALDPESGPYSGPASVGENALFFLNLRADGGAGRPVLTAIDPVDGSPVSERDIPAWESGTGPIPGPSDFVRGGDTFLLSSPGNALLQVVDPFAEDESLFPRWGNGPGDGIGDASPGSDNPAGTAVLDSRYAFSVENGEMPRLNLFIPDGTGAGAFTLPGMFDVQGLQALDTGSWFDGLYFDGTAADGSEGVWYARFDMCEGPVDNNAEWYHQHVCIMTPGKGDTVPAGKPFAVQWHGVDYGRLRVELSTDGGATWDLVEENVTGTGYFFREYRWRVPDVRSSNCLLRFTSMTASYIEHTAGPFAIEGPVAVSGETPRVFGLRPNTPNPFNPSTTLSFTLSEPGNISLTVYDATGRKVTELVRGFHAAGNHSTLWNAKDCASGVYFAVLKVGERKETRKMLLVR